jgi:hypothetical protein
MMDAILTAQINLDSIAIKAISLVSVILAYQIAKFVTILINVISVILVIKLILVMNVS